MVIATAPCKHNASNASSRLTNSHSTLTETFTASSTPKSCKDFFGKKQRRTAQAAEPTSSTTSYGAVNPSFYKTLCSCIATAPACDVGPVTSTIGGTAATPTSTITVTQTALGRPFGNSGPTTVTSTITTTIPTSTNIPTTPAFLIRASDSGYESIYNISSAPASVSGSYLALNTSAAYLYSYTPYFATATSFHLSTAANNGTLSYISSDEGEAYYPWLTPGGSNFDTVFWDTLSDIECNGLRPLECAVARETSLVSCRAPSVEVAEEGLSEWTLDPVGRVYLTQPGFVGRDGLKGVVFTAVYSENA